MPLADLSPDTLDALGDVGDAADSLDAAVGQLNPAVAVIDKLVEMKVLVAIPIIAGLLVAVGLGYFISSYASGSDD
jgi:hypothetical protein